MYPKRPNFYAHKFTRAIFRACAVMELEPRAVLLCVHVVHIEDATRYRQPVQFWNDNLMACLGFKKWDQLNRARKAAVEAGWLVYQSGENKRKAGSYYVAIPEQWADAGDDINSDEITPADGYNRGYIRGYKEGYEAGVKGGTNRGQRGGTLDPIPIPNPGPESEQPPSTDDPHKYTGLT